MSVIGLLKTKLLNIKREIQSSTTTSEKKDTGEWLGKGPPGVNAGGDLLLFFQQQWEQLRENSQSIVGDCKDTEKLLMSTCVRTDEAYTQLNALHTQFTSLPDVITAVEQTCVILGNIQERAEEVHTALELLEDVIEQGEARTQQATLLSRVERHRAQNDRKLAEARAVREASLQRRRDELKAAEAQVSAERQQVFDEAFRSDVQYYQEHGKAADVIKPSEQTAKLEDIVLDSDQQGLDEFLTTNYQAEQSESSSDTQEEDVNDKGSEETYISTIEEPGEQVSTKTDSPESAES